jgi:hypothetical protein
LRKVVRNAAASGMAAWFFEKEREAFAKLDDEAGLELAREIDFDEANVGASEAVRWCGACFGHPSEDARSAADW